MSDDLSLSGSDGRGASATPAPAQKPTEKQTDPAQKTTDLVEETILPGSVADPSPTSEDSGDHGLETETDEDLAFDRIGTFQKIRDVLQGLCDVTGSLEMAAHGTLSREARCVARASRSAAIDYTSKVLLMLCSSCVAQEEKRRTRQ